MLALWARYQVRAVGSATKDIHSSIVCDDGVHSQPTVSGERFAAVAQHPFVDRSPPWTPGRRRIERRQHAAAKLPAHERQSGPAKWQVPGCAAGRAVKGPVDQLEAGWRVIAHGLDLGECPCRS
jgi:hypothetical protein